MLRSAVFGTAMTMAVMASAGQQATAVVRATPAVVYEWNQIVQDTIPGAGGVMAPRFYALVHIAMFDAVNAIEREYEPYRVHLTYSPSGSTEAAAAQAAHDVLVGLNPAGTATYDAALAKYLGSDPSSYVRNGAEVGARVAKEILAWRQNDGWVVSPTPAYSEPALPGKWQPTAPNQTAAFTHLQQATPLALTSSTQFLPPPPPALTSARYATDVNEIKLLGRFDSATRTPEQTATARLWAGVGANGTGTATPLFAIWNNVVRDATRDKHLTLLETTRVFALVNVSIHDSLHTTQTSKFVYGMWRPVTAIRSADTDLNPATDVDAAWLPLITTPPYPSYAGNMATIGATAARALQLAFGTNDMPIALTWRQSGQPDVTHYFDGFSQAADEVYMARIWGGVHFRFDQAAGQQVGRSTAEFVAANYMQLRKSS